LLVVTHIETGTSFGVRRMRAILVTRPRSGKPPVWETPVREGFETNSTICHCVPAQVYILASTPADRHIRPPLGFEIGLLSEDALSAIAGRNGDDIDQDSFVVHGGWLKLYHMVPRAQSWRGEIKKS
jgi:hypothetical protein